MNSKDIYEDYRKNKIPESIELADLQDSIYSQYGILHSFFGYKTVNGELTDDLSIVCLVDKKLDRVKNYKKIPKTLKIKIDESVRIIKTDVVEASADIIPHYLINPGDKVFAVNASATVGFYGRSLNFGKVFISAGHFGADAGGMGRNVVIQDAVTSKSITCKIAKCVVNQEADYCLLQPLENESPTSFQFGSNSVNSIYNPVSVADLQQDLYVIRGTSAVKTRLLGVGFKSNDGSINYSNLLVTSCVTVPGDSGAALIDKNLRLWGIVMGASRDGAYSFYMAASTLMRYEQLGFGV